MSWGFIVDLQASVDAKALPALKKMKVRTVELGENWAGFEDDTLKQAFKPSGSDLSFGEVLESIEEGLVEEDDGTLRVVALLDRSQLDVASALAALLLGMDKGALTLCNDGTYSGDDGKKVSLTKGKLVSKKLKNYDATLEELSALLTPEMPAAPPPKPAAKASPEPSTAFSLDPAEAARATYQLRVAGKTAAALDYFLRYFAEGGRATKDILYYYHAYLREQPPADVATHTKRILANYAADKTLLMNARPLEDAIAFMNERGGARESVELALEAVQMGLAWTGNLAANTCYSAWVANDASLSDQVLASIDASGGAALASLPFAFGSKAMLLMRRKDFDGALACLAEGAKLQPQLLGAWKVDADFGPLHGDPRWARLVG